MKKIQMMQEEHGEGGTVPIVYPKGIDVVIVLNVRIILEL
uniref:Uncharacterized protein n=1 Tax=Heterorhabditis bacteriophora TaxID=37862 RepID=A0A1I7W7E8_HETBA